MPWEQKGKLLLQNDVEARGEKIVMKNWS